MPASSPFFFPGEYRRYAESVRKLLVELYGGLTDEARGVAIGTNSADEETETKKALDRVMEDLPKGRIVPKDCDRLVDAAGKAKKQHEAFTNIIGRKP